MSARNIFTWSGRTQTGLGLFAASLFYLAFAAPNAVAIAFAIGAGACLALTGITGSRFWLTVLTLLMLAVSAAALFAALVVNSYVLLPVALAQIIAVSLIEGRRESDWVGGSTTRSGLLSAWKRQRV
jgi:hypothetical protein